MKLRIRQRVLRHYKIVDLLPESGQAFLAIARDGRSQSTVVLKCLKLPTDDAAAEVATQRFERERSLHIGHPRVVEPIDSGIDDDRHILVFPFIEGPTLEQFVLKHRGRLEIPTVIVICDQVAEALSASHAKGVVHRDLKPQNIIIHPQDGARLIDMGIARVVHESTLTTDKGLLGSLPWMSPEQINSATTVGPAADLYGLGAVMYFMLTGQPPIDESEPSTVLARIFQGPAPRPSMINPSVPDHLDALCTRLLDRDLRRRPRSAADVRTLLRNKEVPPSHAMGQCPRCGHQSPPAARFCLRCGAGVDEHDDTTALPRCLACRAPAPGMANAPCPGCGREFSPEDHRLSFISGPAAGAVFRIPQGAYQVGRAQICSRDLHISSHQLNVTCRNGTVEFQHAGSVNTTYVNRTPAHHGVLLAPHAEIRFAGNIATYTRT